MTRIGTYTVVAHFKPDSPDYTAPSIRATLKIIDKQIELDYHYDQTEFVYNGKIQVPKFTFTDPDGNEIETNYHLTGNGVDANDAGN